MNGDDGDAPASAVMAVAASTTTAIATAPLSGSLNPSLISLASHGASSQTTFRRSTVSSQQRQRRAQWKGIGSRCMWDAFRATLFSLFCLFIGSVIVIIGKVSEQLCVPATLLYKCLRVLSLSVFIILSLKKKGRRASCKNVRDCFFLPSFLASFILFTLFMTIYLWGLGASVVSISPSRRSRCATLRYAPSRRSIYFS